MRLFDRTYRKQAQSNAGAARFMGDKKGATAIEYGLIVSLLFLAITAALNNYAQRTNAMYSTIQSNLSSP